MKTRQPQQTTESADPQAFWSAGWRPDRQGADRPMPYAHLSAMDSGSLQAGLGMIHGSWGNGAALDVLSANGEIGLMGGAGQRRLGARGDAQMFKGNTPTNFPIGGEMGIFDAAAEASIGQDGATLGAGASVIDGALRLGSNNKDRANDTTLRIGAGFGVGAAGRLHWGDTDQDGHREYGFGADVGPVSFDLKTEDPLMTLASGLTGGLASGLAPKDFNLTDTVTSGVSNAWSWLTGGK